MRGAPVTITGELFGLPTVERVAGPSLCRTEGMDVLDSTVVCGRVGNTVAGRAVLAGPANEPATVVDPTRRPPVAGRAISSRGGVNGTFASPDIRARETTTVEPLRAMRSARAVVVEGTEASTSFTVGMAVPVMRVTRSRPIPSLMTVVLLWIT